MTVSEPQAACNRRPQTTSLFNPSSFSWLFFHPSPFLRVSLSSVLLPRFLLPLCAGQTCFVSCFQLLGAQLPAECSPAFEAKTLTHIQVTLCCWAVEFTCAFLLNMEVRVEGIQLIRSRPVLGNTWNYFNWLGGGTVSRKMKSNQPFLAFLWQMWPPSWTLSTINSSVLPSQLVSFPMVTNMCWTVEVSPWILGGEMCPST